MRAGAVGLRRDLLAHFSTSRAADAERAAVNVPVLTAPHAAVGRTHAMVDERAKARVNP